jgi:N-acylneuraminate cytidylyltransferase
VKDRCLAIIPARGGSKRIPRKNIKEFCGEPIISYSIKSAIRTSLFDKIMVSTDDDEIAGISKMFGAAVPFIRSKETSNDFAGIADVLLEVLSEYEKRGQIFDSLCCILPTAPFIRSEKIIEAYNLFKQKSYDSVLTVAGFAYPIFRALQIDNSKVSMIWPENYSKRSQDLPAAFHDAGQFYWISVKKFMENKLFFTDKTGAVILSEMEVQDIDTEEDWKIAEMKYQYRIKNSLS